MNQTSQFFKTSDLYLSALIQCRSPELPLTLEVVNGRTVFVFMVSDSLYEAMNAYNNGSLVNAFEYAQTIKRLRAEMIMRRQPR